MSADMFQAKSTDIFLLIHSLRITVGVHNTHTHTDAPLIHVSQIHLAFCTVFRVTFTRYD